MKFPIQNMQHIWFHLSGWWESLVRWFTIDVATDSRVERSMISPKGEIMSAATYVIFELFLLLLYSGPWLNGFTSQNSFIIGEMDDYWCGDHYHYYHTPINNQATQHTTTIQQSLSRNIERLSTGRDWLPLDPVRMKHAKWDDASWLHFRRNLDSSLLQWLSHLFIRRGIHENSRRSYTRIHRELNPQGMTIETWNGTNLS